mmetsp:Transcript_28868/g.60781  ORF Transcript_28868/g.60781 Transcript_28868/m.60781 type:complete len:93 (+) Transcript_28868:604-882(+)
MRHPDGLHQHERLYIEVLSEINGLQFAPQFLVYRQISPSIDVKGLSDFLRRDVDLGGVEKEIAQSVIGLTKCLEAGCVANQFHDCIGYPLSH